MPVPLVIVIVAEPVPLPEQTPDVLMLTRRPDDAVAATLKVALYVAFTGAGVVTEIVWPALLTVCVKAPEALPLKLASPE